MNRILQCLIIVLILSWSSVSGVSGAGPFYADTLQQYVTVTDPGTEQETAVLPCKLVYFDGNYKEPMALRWSKPVPKVPGDPDPGVYNWNEHYDGKLPHGDDRFHRYSDNFDERFYLRIRNVSARDEGTYCCELLVNQDRKDFDCLDLHYKNWNPSNVKLSCDEGSSKTTDIVLPAKVTAQIDFYPEENEPGDMRQFRIYNADNPTMNTHTSTFRAAGDRYNASLTMDVTEPGVYGFYASLPYKWGEDDEIYIRCTYIQIPETPQPSVAVSDPETKQEATALPLTCTDVDRKGRILIGVVIALAVTSITELAVIVIICRTGNNPTRTANREDTRSVQKESDSEEASELAQFVTQPANNKPNDDFYDGPEDDSGINA